MHQKSPLEMQNPNIFLGRGHWTTPPTFAWHVVRMSHDVRANVTRPLHEYFANELRIFALRYIRIWTYDLSYWPKCFLLLLPLWCRWYLMRYYRYRHRRRSWGDTGDASPHFWDWGTQMYIMSPHFFCHCLKTEDVVSLFYDWKPTEFSGSLSNSPKSCWITLYFL